MRQNRGPGNIGRFRRINSAIQQQICARILSSLQQDAEGVLSYQMGRQPQEPGGKKVRSAKGAYQIRGPYDVKRRYEAGRWPTSPYVGVYQRPAPWAGMNDAFGVTFTGPQSAGKPDALHALREDRCGFLSLGHGVRQAVPRGEFMESL